MWTTLIIACAVATVFSFILMVSAIGDGQEEIAGVMFLVFLSFTIATFFCTSMGGESAKREYEYKITNHIYEKERTFVTGVYKDKLDTKDGCYYITKDSKFLHPDTLKLDQVVTVYYINPPIFNSNLVLIDVVSEE